MIGALVPFSVFINDTIQCRLNKKSYSIHQVPPGAHRFTVQFSGKKSKVRAEPIVIDIEAGETYYIQLITQSGLIKNNLYCQEVTASSASTILPTLKEDTRCLKE